MARKSAAYTTNQNGTGANLGFETTLWATADKLRGHMDPSEYKHVVLGLIFLKYISDAFEERHNELTLYVQDPNSEYYVKEPADYYMIVEDRDAYTSENIFWVPQEARWQTLKSAAKMPDIGRRVDDAMHLIEKENPTLKGVLPKDYARPTLSKEKLGELIDLISLIGLGDRENRSKDILGRVYEYFLGKFAGQEGRGGGEHYTPRCVVRLLVEMIEPFRGRVYDPCCGSAGMFVQSEEFIKEHGGKLDDIAIFGQESNPTTWRLARMNMALRGIDVDLGPHNGDTFHNDLHRDKKFDYILANPHFNASDWGGERLTNDVRWKYGVPPVGNANYAWVQHIVYHLAPNGVAGFVLANGSLSSNNNNEGVIRKNLIEADLVDCVVALPPQLFYGTQIPACLWFLARNKADSRFRRREGETLFLDARKLGSLIDRTHRELTKAEIRRIADVYHAWRGEEAAGEYADVSGFAKSATLADITAHGFVLTPGRYVGAEDVEEDSEAFAAKFDRLTALLTAQFAESAQLEAAICENLKGLQP